MVRQLVRRDDKGRVGAYSGAELGANDDLTHRPSLLRERISAAMRSTIFGAASEQNGHTQTHIDAGKANLKLHSHSSLNMFAA